MTIKPFRLHDTDQWCTDLLMLFKPNESVIYFQISRMWKATPDGKYRSLCLPHCLCAGACDSTRARTWKTRSSSRPHWVPLWVCDTPQTHSNTCWSLKAKNLRHPWGRRSGISAMLPASGCSETVIWAEGLVKCARCQCPYDFSWSPEVSGPCSRLDRHHSLLSLFHEKSQFGWLCLLSIQTFRSEIGCSVSSDSDWKRADLVAAATARRSTSFSVHFFSPQSSFVWFYFLSEHRREQSSHSSCGPRRSTSPRHTQFHFWGGDVRLSCALRHDQSETKTAQL